MTAKSEEHHEKHSSHNTSTERGIMISANPLFEKAYFSIRFNWEFNSNVTEVRDSHPKRHLWHKAVTDAGTRIEVKALSSKTHCSNDVRFDFPSKAIDRIDCGTLTRPNETFWSCGIHNRLAHESDVTTCSHCSMNPLVTRIRRGKEVETGLLRGRSSGSSVPIYE
jgi:hypothetical protein